MSFGHFESRDKIHISKESGKWVLFLCEIRFRSLQIFRFLNRKNCFEKKGQNFFEMENISSSFYFCKKRFKICDAWNTAHVTFCFWKTLVTNVKGRKRELSLISGNIGFIEKFLEIVAVYLIRVSKTILVKTKKQNTFSRTVTYTT